MPYEKNHAAFQDDEWFERERRNILNVRNWNRDLIGQTFYQICQDNKNKYRTIQFKWNPFVESLKPIRINRFKDRLNKALGADANREKGMSTSKGVKSQRALCSDLEITIGKMTKYLRGEVDSFEVKIRIQQKLASTLNMSLDSLMVFYSTGKIVLFIKQALRT